MRGEQELTGFVSVAVDQEASRSGRWWGVIQLPEGLSLPIGGCQLVTPEGASSRIMLERMVDDRKAFFLGLGAPPHL